jgi:hypothetical protein
MLQVTWLVNHLKTTANMNYVHRFQLVTCNKYAPSLLWNSQLIFCGEIMAVLSERHANTQMHSVGRSDFFLHLVVHVVT